MCFPDSRFIPVFFAALVALTAAACSNDDDSDNPSKPQAPPADRISFSISGADEGSKTGECSAYIENVLGEYFVDISGNDGIEEADPEMTFNISFSYSGSTPVSAGTYPIDYEAYLSGEGFFVSYDLIDESAGSFELFGSTYPQEGSIAVTAVTETSITGTFSFTAANQAGTDEVVVTQGMFNALADD